MLRYEAVLQLLARGMWVAIIPQDDNGIALFAYRPEASDVEATLKCTQHDIHRTAIALCRKAHNLSREHS